MEINALWYNALKIFNELGRKLGKEAKNLEVISQLEVNFIDVFWFESGQYLYNFEGYLKVNNYSSAAKEKVWSMY